MHENSCVQAYICYAWLNCQQHMFNYGNMEEKETDTSKIEYLRVFRAAPGHRLWRGNHHSDGAQRGADRKL